MDTSLPDELSAWRERYLRLAVAGVRSPAVAAKIALHLQRFTDFFHTRYGHERIATCLRRDVLDWQHALRDEQGLAPATVNNHLAALSAFTTWVHAQDPHRFARGDPAKGIPELGLPPLEPRALDTDQIRSLKNLCDRLERFHQRTGRRIATTTPPPIRATGRPWRDRAIVFVLLSTGLRREELVRLNLDQLEPNTSDTLRAARRARLTRVRGKGQTERRVFLSADARAALADYLDRERERDAGETAKALFLSAAGLPARAADGRLSPRAINLPLSEAEVRFILAHHWTHLGITEEMADFTDAETLAAIIRITNGNFRLLQRLFAQIARVLTINQLQSVTKEVVEAARASLVRGFHTGPPARRARGPVRLESALGAPAEQARGGRAAPRGCC